MEDEEATAQLEFLPIASEGFTTEEAEEWLRDDLDCWLGLIGVGFGVPDEKVREEFGLLCADVRRMVDSCLKAMQSRSPVRVKTWGPGSPDFPECTMSIARIISALQYDEGGGEGAAGWAFAELARALPERIRAEAHGEQEMRDET